MHSDLKSAAHVHRRMVALGEKGGGGELPECCRDSAAAYPFYYNPKLHGSNRDVHLLRAMLFVLSRDQLFVAGGAFYYFTDEAQGAGEGAPTSRIVAEYQPKPPFPVCSPARSLRRSFPLHDIPPFFRYQAGISRTSYLLHEHPHAKRKEQGDAPPGLECNSTTGPTPATQVTWHNKHKFVWF